MANKGKSYKTPALQFISTSEEAATPRQETRQEDFIVPKGYKLVRENKSERLQLLVRQTTKEALRRMAAKQGRSLNDLVNQILDEYTERQGNA